MAELDAQRPELTIPVQDYEQGVHASLGCSGCHSNVGEFPHEPVTPPQCSICHSEQSAEFDPSVHGQSLQSGRVGAARCQDCHGPTHAIRSASDPVSPASHQRLAETCGSCHGNATLMRQFQLPLFQPFESYSHSVHAKALAEGKNAANCADCHGAHAIFRATDNRSKVFRFQISETCGACHEGIYGAYQQSVHGQAIARGITGAAVCSDCHGEHAILSSSERDSPVYMANVSQQACSRCHADERLNERYNLPADRVRSYQQSYHGLAARAGSLRVANCASCHGVHNILPSSDPRSSIAPANLGATCGQCHPGAGTRFEIGPVHTLPESPAAGAIYWIRWFYLILIPLVLGAMFLHNLADFIQKARQRFAAQQNKPQLLRMTRNERWQHVLLLTSFFVLVISGFALKFPESFWARPFVVWEGQWPVRAWLHRLAGIVMIGAAALHLFYLWNNRDARRRWRLFLPRRTDWNEFWQRLGFNLGLRPSRPLLSEMSYVEKAEYWSVVWGTALMVVTGLVLWNNNLTLRYLSKWLLDVATVIHYYEAILATLAIAVWHFYSVIFDPDHYPMHWTWISGKTDAQHWQETRHPAESFAEQEQTTSQDPPAVP